MSTPEIIIALLLGLAGILVLVRLALALSRKSQGVRQGGCESGMSKTIGTRELQEDEYGIVESETGMMAVLADGTGKNYGGRIASRIAVQVFLDMFEDQNAFYNPQYYFRKAFQGANREILNQVQEGQGSACVGAVMIRDRKLYYAVVGSVKIAVWRNQELVPISAGHTIDVLARQKFQEGKLTRQEAVSLFERHRLYNYVGQDGFRDIEFFDKPVTLYGGEYVLLLSDGLYDGAKWKELELCLEAGGSCQDIAYNMVDLVNDSVEEEKDNAAVVVLRVR